MKSRKDIIIRHSPVERINHWAVVLCFFFTAISGLGFFFPSFNWLMNIFGTPQLSRILHPFVGSVMFILFIFMFFRYFKHNFIDKDDIIWLKNIRKIVKNEEAGDIGQYNLGQKGVYWSITIFLILLAVSGVIIWRPYFADLFSIPIIRIALLIHSMSAIGLILTIMVHAYAAFWVKGTLRAMVEGWVTRGWAKKHHPRWYREIMKQEQQEEKR
ncbi:formate dehydrogenase cytochrome b556 subunit [Photorhabdus laumondii subsp. laumondii]|uniref:Formate dehydrogenase, cytochrome B556(FDO) subunit (Formate dehydrogenase-O gamma subunit) (FDH-Z gamma subunit) (Aerobic formate dehydrogenase cytochrome B556 subunit) n=2 Tax=Photorhabdus laumondii subsp. laumondii TaxID=141679 RepID=Q7MY09_PHOLL|nr:MULTISPECIES: formate dehydrogenase cytochrome b556 subunit [Photorhabdus]AWK44374.1 formate dehydrogenase [Photorhabdus laumondii subsp. laumondii]AXG45100.1 formate dehydrogenase cytochrome b556 subunit [Photorhabdus laumondii subsp. laumondii]AXG49686.1 formate dehydrogenase cytochrome b556 subunit [Photorhabdus laumondii subsp. laumondii]MCC8383368.1 formate dehydrogenase cytochrome b556 subunit [Photorhabdus laumondii]MCC8390549.1 formate dehydrogenase cytochrome b556 subunit [Photorha